MYGKILHGSGFGGLVNYANDPRKNATLIAASSGINLTNNQSITDSFMMQASLSYRTKKPVAHFVLAFSPHDAERINDKMLERIVRDYLQRMGYDDNQFVAFRHFDKEHPHVHIIVNRVNNRGKCTKDSHEKDRNVKVCKDLTKEYGLYMARGKEAVKEKRLRTMDSIRFMMMHGVRESLQVASNWKEFQQELAKLGIRFQFRFNPSNSAIEGISFTISKDMVKDGRGNSQMRHDVSFSGKQLDPSLTLSNLCDTLGNPVALVHDQVRDMYEDEREDWYDSHNGIEVQRIDEVFPELDDLFPWQASSPHEAAPGMEGSGFSISPTFIEDLFNSASDIADAGNGCIYAGLQTMGELILQPYQPALSAGGGGGSSSKLGWGDDDKYKKRHSVYRSRGKGCGWGY